MNLSEFCIKRPVFAVVLSLILIVVGILGFNYLDTRFLPKFEKNRLRIDTEYSGASAKLVETSITTPLEEAISGVQGIDTIESTSYQGYSQIKVTVTSGVNIDEFANKIRNKVEDARGNLPDNVSAPTVEIGNNEGELMDIGFVDPHQSLNAVRDYLNRYVIKRIEQIAGISQVEVIGGFDYAMRVHIDPQKMAAHHLSVNEITAAIQNSNIELPAGEIKGNTVNFPITATTKLKTIQDFDNVVIKYENGNSIHIKDIGYAKLGAKSSDDSFVRINNRPAVLLSVRQSENANPLDAAKRVNKFLNDMQSQLPNSMKIIHAYDQSIFMQESVNEVYQSILIAICCVILIIFLFLGQFRTVFIPIITIPICLVATFGLMYAFGFTINVITLLALVLSIGLVVDDAIVMLENIYRHIEGGEKPMIAAIKGSKEITFSVIAMTLTLAAVYAPVALVHGQISAIFRPFALTLAGGVIISGFVALTLSPMMCSRLLSANQPQHGYYHFLEKSFKRLSTIYQSFLHAVLSKKYITIILTVFIITGGYFLLRHIPFTFMPSEDIGIIVASINTPSGTNIHSIAHQTEQISELFHPYPEAESIVSIASTNEKAFNFSFVTLKPFKQRHRSAETIADAVNQKIKKIPGLNASAFPPSFGGSMHHQLEFSITSTDDYQSLYRASQILIGKLEKYPGLHDIETSVKFDSQQYNLSVKRSLSANLQVSIKDIDNTLAIMFGGVKISTIDIDGRTYDVYTQGLEKNRYSLSNINAFYVKSAQGKLIPLSSLIHITPVLTQTTLPHYNRTRSATISAQLTPGYNLGAVVTYLQHVLPNILPNGIHYAFTGRAKRVIDSHNSMLLIFILALVFIYLVLSAQFESFLDPLIILLVVPLSVIGALLSLKLIDGSINIYTIVGLVTLIGLIAKHGILITQFANTLQKKGLSPNEALIKAASTRLRPILMTTAAMIVGALPLIFASGANAVSRSQIGMIIVGGLFFGTFFSLVLVPVTYSYAAKLKNYFKKNITV